MQEILGAQLIKAFMIAKVYKSPKEKSKLPVAPGLC